MTLAGKLHFLRCLKVITVCSAVPYCIVPSAALASSVDSSNSLAMRVANMRPTARFGGPTVISPPGLWLTYAAVYISATSKPRPSTTQRLERQDDLLDLAHIMGYSAKPSHESVLSDATALKASAGGSNIAMQLWIENSDLGGPNLSELDRLGVSVVNRPRYGTYRSQMNAWLSQHSDGAFRAIGTEVPPFNTGVLFTTVKHALAFQSSFREDSVVAPSIIPTTMGGVASLPGKEIAYYSDSSGIMGIRLAAASGRFLLFSGSPNALQRSLMACRSRNCPR